jgi:hypothetical protein
MLSCVEFNGTVSRNYVYRSIDHSSRMLDVVQQPTGQTPRFLLKLVCRSNCISLCADPGPAHQHRVHAHAMDTHAMHSCTMHAHVMRSFIMHAYSVPFKPMQFRAKYAFLTPSPTTALWTEIGFPYTCGDV